MSGFIRQIYSSDGTPITAPTAIAFSASQLYSFADDAAYEAQFGAGAQGYIYFNTTDQQVRIYKNGAWEYAKADEIVYDNSGSALAATDTQAAIDELDGTIDSISTDLGSLEVQVDNHEAATTAHGVSGVVAGTQGSTFDTMSIAFEDIATDVADIAILPTKIGVRMTGLTAIRNLVEIDPANTGEMVLVNDSAFALTIVNEHGAATAANRIITGTGAAISLAPGASLKLTYDSTETRWRVIGGTGSGSGGGGGGGGLEVVSISAAQTLDVSSHYLVDSSGGGFTLTLPDPAGFTAEDLLAARIVVEDSALATATPANEFSVAPHSGGIIATNSSVQAVDETLVHDRRGWAVQYSWDDTLGHWKAQDYLGASGGSGKNYILNPNGSSGLANVSGVVTTGSWSLEITGTPSELPEQSVGSAFKISGSGLTVGDYVAWSISDSLIDSVDGGRFGSASIAVKDISGTSSGEYSLQVYDVDNSVYVGDEVLVEGTGLYLVDVPLRAGGDYEAHLKAEVIAPTSIGVSGVTIEPVSQTIASYTGRWEDFVPDFNLTSAYTVNTARKRYNGQNLEMMVEISPTAIGTPSGNLRLTLPDGLQASGSGYAASGSGYWLRPIASSGSQYVITAEMQGATALEFRVNLASGGGPYFAQNQNINNTDRISFFVSVPVAELANAYTPTLSDVQYENARVRYYLASNTAVGAGGVVPYDTKDSSYNSNGTWTSSPSSGVIPINGEGTYEITVSNITTANTGGTNSHILQVDTGGGFSDKVYIETNQAGVRTFSGTVRISLDAGDDIRVKTTPDPITYEGGSTKSYIEITRISDYSARKASLPISDAANETKQYLVPEYREATVVLTDSGANLIDATLKITKIGNVVTITSDGNITHTSGSSVDSALGVIPAWALPTTYDATNLFYNDGNGFQAGFVYPDGKIKILYRNYAGAVNSATGTTRPFNVSYVIT